MFRSVTEAVCKKKKSSHSSVLKDIQHIFPCYIVMLLPCYSSDFIFFIGCSDMPCNIHVLIKTAMECFSCPILFLA